MGAALPWQVARADLRQIARDRTMILVWSGSREGRIAGMTACDI